MKKIIFAISLIAFCSFNNFAQSDISPEEYRIYSKVLRKETNEAITIEDKSSIFDPGLENKKDIPKRVRESLPQIPKTLLSDFAERNKSDYKFQKRFHLRKYKIVTSNDVKKAFGEEDEIDKRWENFYKIYPNSNGIYSLSKIGFSKNRRWALIFISNFCGSLCGEGRYILLKKTGNRWKITKQESVWVS